MGSTRNGHGVYALLYPICRFGMWGNDVEIGVISGLLVYDTELSENRAAVRLRLNAGGEDRCLRSLGCRLALEEWKARQGIIDQMAFPPAEPASRTLWNDMMTVGTWDQKATTMGFVRFVVTPQVPWCWKVNIQRTTPPGAGTLTGVRTPSVFWRNKTNTTWDPLLRQISPRTSAKRDGADGTLNACSSTQKRRTSRCWTL